MFTYKNKHKTYNEDQFKINQMFFKNYIWHLLKNIYGNNNILIDMGFTIQPDKHVTRVMDSIEFNKIVICFFAKYITTI